MKKELFFLAGLFLFPAVRARAQDMPVSEFVQQLESRYYSPLRCGLADYRCEIDDALLENLISALSKNHPANKPILRKLVGLNARLTADSRGITITGAPGSGPKVEDKAEEAGKEGDDDEGEGSDADEKDSLDFNLVAEWSKFGVKVWDALSFSLLNDENKAFLKSAKVKKTTEGYEVSGKKDEGSAAVFYFDPDFKLEKIEVEDKDGNYTTVPRYVRGAKGWLFTSCKVEGEDLICLVKVNYRKMKGFDLPGRIDLSFGGKDKKGNFSPDAIVITDSLIFKGYQVHAK